LCRNALSQPRYPTDHENIATFGHDYPAIAQFPAATQPQHDIRDPRAPLPRKSGSQKAPQDPVTPTDSPMTVFAKPSTTMHNTAAMPMHTEWLPSKEWLVPMEVVVEASPASTQDMEVDEDLKKWARMKTIMTSTTDIAMKESPEQKRIQNAEKTMEKMMVFILFIGTEEMIYKEEVQDNQAAHK